MPRNLARPATVWKETAASEKNDPRKPPPSKTCRWRQRPNDGGAPAKTSGYFMKLRGNSQSETQHATNHRRRATSSPEPGENDILAAQCSKRLMCSCLQPFLWWHACRVQTLANCRVLFVLLCRRHGCLYKGSLTE